MIKSIFKYCVFGVFIAFTSCRPKPAIQISDTLETGLDERYFDYVLKLNSAVDGDTSAVHEFLIYKDIYDGAAFEHGWILLELMKHIGEISFAKAINNLSQQQINQLSTYFRGGLDIHTEGDKLLKEYPLIFKTLEQNKIPANGRTTEQREKVSPEIYYRDSVLQKYSGRKRFMYTSTVDNGKYSVVVETFCLNDTLASDEDSEYDDAVFPLITRPIITKQKLIFKEGEVVLKEYNIPFKEKILTNYLGKRIKGLEQNIWRIYLIRGTGGEVYGISGTGLCVVGSNCPEFTGLYTMNGSILYEASTGRKSKVDYNKLLEKYGISNNTMQAGMNDGVRVDIFWNGN